MQINLLRSAETPRSRTIPSVGNEFPDREAQHCTADDENQQRFNIPPEPDDFRQVEDSRPAGSETGIKKEGDQAELDTFDDRRWF
ncbi:MAG TPA: hypothetical protein VFG52_11405 [Xanthomonadales bacterium]|nr:hypothetical protein [Xanthomonadales bacterium]